MTILEFVEWIRNHYQLKSKIRALRCAAAFLKTPVTTLSGYIRADRADRASSRKLYDQIDRLIKNPPCLECLPPEIERKKCLNRKKYTKRKINPASYFENEYRIKIYREFLQFMKNTYPMANKSYCMKKICIVLKKSYSLVWKWDIGTSIPTNDSVDQMMQIMAAGVADAQPDNPPADQFYKWVKSFYETKKNSETIKKISEILQASEQSVRMWMNDKRPPRPSILVLMKRIMDATLAEEFNTDGKELPTIEEFLSWAKYYFAIDGESALAQQLSEMLIVDHMTIWKWRKGICKPRPYMYLLFKMIMNEQKTEAGK